MRNFEVTLIVDPVLSGEEIKSVVKTYQDSFEKEGAKIVHVDEIGLRQLAYPIKKRSSGVYYCIEFEVENGDLISKIELALRRDERIIRFLTVKLDKFGVKYNEDKRNGLIGKVKKKEKKKKPEGRYNRNKNRPNRSSTPPPPAKEESKAPAKEADASTAKSETAPAVEAKVETAVEAKVEAVAETKVETVVEAVKEAPAVAPVVAAAPIVAAATENLISDAKAEEE